MYEIFIHSFFSRKLLAYIFNSKNLKPGYKEVVGVCTLLLIIIVYLFYQYINSVPNLYHVLGVSSNIDNFALKKVFNNLRKLYHPDINSDPESETIFIYITKAYEMLSDERRRFYYDHFGPDLVDAVSATGQNIYAAYAMSLVINYSIWIFITFCMMLGDEHRRGLNWMVCYIVGCLIADVQFSFSSAPTPLSLILPYATNYEKMQLLKMSFPLVLSSCSVYSVAVYVSLDDSDLLRAVVHRSHNTLNNVAALLVHMETVLKRATMVTDEEGEERLLVDEGERVVPLSEGVGEDMKTNDTLKKQVELCRKDCLEGPKIDLSNPRLLAYYSQEQSAFNILQHFVVPIVLGTIFNK